MHLIYVIGLATILAPLPALAQEAVNPMTGRPLSYEQKMRSVEESSLDAKRAEEELRRAKAEEELKRVRTGVSGRPITQMPEAAQFNAQTRAPTLPNSTPNRPVPTARVTPVAPEGTVPVPVQVPRVAGILRSGNEYIALMESGNQTTIVRAGDQWGGAKVGLVEADRVQIGDRSMMFRPGDARFEVSERQPPRYATSVGAPPYSEPMTPNTNRPSQLVPRAVDLPGFFKP